MELDQHFILSIFHLVIIAPFLLFIGFKRATTPTWVFQSLLAIGSVVMAYHFYRMLFRWKAHSSFIWVNIIHVVLIAPLLLFIGFQQKDTPTMYYELLLMLAFALVGYHLFSMIRHIDSHPDTK